MAIADDFQIQVDKDIRYIGAAHGVTGAGYYTVIEFHRFLQDLADAAAITNDDYLDITRDTPTNRQTDNIIELINGYNIDQTASEHLYDGSVIQSLGAEIYEGILVFSSPGMGLQIIQNGARVTNDFWNNTPFGASFSGLNADAANGISHRFMLLVRTGGADIDGRRLIGQTREWGQTYSEFRINGTARGNNVLALTYAADLNNATVVGTIAGYTDIVNLTQGYALLDVDGNTTDEAYYSEWDRGSRTINDLYERMKWLTRRGTAETIYGLNGELFRGITHEIDIDTPTGTFDPFEAVSWSGGTGQMLAIDSPTAGTKMWIQLRTGVIPTDGQTITGGTSGGTADVNITVLERTLSFPFAGVSTGSALIGSYGFGVQTADLSASDLLFDLTNTQRTPPNNVTFTVNGLVDGEDRVLVGPRGYRFAYDNEGGTPPFVVGETLTFTAPAGTAVLAALLDLGATGEMVIGPMLTGTVPANNSTISGGTSGATADVNGVVFDAINLRQLSNVALVNGAAVTSIVVNEVIPTDTPTTGTIRIQRADGQYTRHAYTGYATSTFTIGSTDFSTNTIAAGANVFISYIDELATADFASFTSVFLSSRDLFVRARDGGGTPIKTFETTGTLGAAGGSATVIRTSDA